MLSDHLHDERVRNYDRTLKPSELLELSYEKFCQYTDKYPRGPEHGLLLGLGLCSEAGEVAGKLKKALRDCTDHDKLVYDLQSELGDVLWYAQRLSSFYGLGTIFDLQNANRAKLIDRIQRGQISGSGDHR